MARKPSAYAQGHRPESIADRHAAPLLGASQHAMSLITVYLMLPEKVLSQDHLFCDVGDDEQC